MVRCEASVKLTAHISIHDLSVVPSEERSERVPAIEGIHFGPVQVPWYVRQERRHEVIGRPLRVEFGVSISLATAHKH